MHIASLFQKKLKQKMNERIHENTERPVLLEPERPVLLEPELGYVWNHFFFYNKYVAVFNNDVKSQIFWKASVASVSVLFRSRLWSLWTHLQPQSERKKRRRKEQRKSQLPRIHRFLATTLFYICFTYFLYFIAYFYSFFKRENIFLYTMNCIPDFLLSTDFTKAALYE